MADVILATTPLDPLAQPLIADLTREYDSRYGSYFEQDGAVKEMNRYAPALFAPPDGNFLLLLRDGEAIAGGAFKRYDEHTAEVKRMWTRRDLRRQGLASTVLVALESQALAQGYSHFYLTTGFRQPEAVKLYLAHGYKALFDLDADPETYRTLPFRKVLRPAPSLQLRGRDRLGGEAGLR